MRMRSGATATFFGLFLLLGMGVSASAQDASETGEAGAADAPLGALFQKRSAPVDPEVQPLEAVLAQLQERARTLAAERALVAEAKQAIEQVRALREHAAEPAKIARKTQIAWALLSLADRRLALAQQRAELHALEARAQLAQQAAEQARWARVQAEQALAAAKEPNR